ncbi:MAG: sigma-70 family RNA polymerase sigma factor [Phycisphaerae bacterium]|nr:sigma-70 family RNA polymerase sigma factor [Phycisphaerae bacterium]
MAVPSTAISLLSRCRDTSDQRAWRELDERYRELLLRFCRRRGLAAIEAEDIVQRVFVGLAKSLPAFTYDRSRGRFRDYLFRCTRNSIYQFARCPERGLSPLPPDEGGILVDDSAVSPAESASWEAEWVAHHYRLALTAVRRDFEPQSMAVFERCMAGASVQEVMRELGMSEAAVQKARQRVRIRMQELIVEQVREEDRVDEEPISR